MSSPFPGMDPYLERRPLWGVAHNIWIHQAADWLRPQAPDYFIDPEGETDLSLDLKDVTERTYEALRSALRVHYDQPPEPPLVGAAAAWADRLLRDRRLR